MADALTLLIETSGRIGQVGLGARGAVRASRRLDPNRRHARDLAPAVADLLAELGAPAAAITRVAVGLGPGSYTGLRVGIASAQAFAFARDIPAVGVDTFAILARAVPGSFGRIDVIADAHLDKLYRQTYRHLSGAWVADGPLEILPVRDWSAGRDAERLVVGPGRSVVVGAVRLGEPAITEPRLDDLLALADTREPCRGVAGLIALQPIYGRPSSAELNWTAARSI